MSDLEEKGYLYHPHTSAGRVPTDVAYRVYVDSLIRRPAARHATERRPADRADRDRRLGGRSNSPACRAESGRDHPGAWYRAWSDASRTPCSSASSSSGSPPSDLLVALTLSGGAVRTIFVEARGEIADAAIAEVTRVLNERLAGLTLRQIRASLGDGCATRPRRAKRRELLNVFIEEGDQLFDTALESATTRCCWARRRCSPSSRSSPASTTCGSSSR